MTRCKIITADETTPRVTVQHLTNGVATWLLYLFVLRRCQMEEKREGPACRAVVEIETILWQKQKKREEKNDTHTLEKERKVGMGRLQESKRFYINI